MLKHSYMIDIDAMAFSQSFTLHKQQVDKGRSLRPKAEGEGFGEGQLAPHHQLWVWGSAVSSPRGVWGGAPEAKHFALLYVGSVVVPLIFISCFSELKLEIKTLVYNGVCR